MSKMSQMHAELEEQAVEYGFDSLQEALDTGEYEVVYGPYRAYLDKKDGQAEAHEAWLKEKEEVIKGLRALLNLWSNEYTNYELRYVLGKSQETIGKAIEFIEKGEQ